MCAATILCRVDQANDTLSGATIAADDGPPVYAVDECASTPPLACNPAGQANESGADAGLVEHHMPHGPPQRRTSCIGISQQWRVPHRWQFGHPSTSVLIKTAGGYRGGRPRS
jgi:hypothetical protein